MQFTTYKLFPHGKGGWYWQVTKEVGAAQIVIARSGVPYLTEDQAIAGYKEFVKWASTFSGTPPPPA